MRDQGRSANAAAPVREDPDVTRLRTAHAGDADAVVGIFQSARAAALPYLPVVHSAAEDRAFFDRLVTSGATTVAVEAERVLGFIVLGATRVEHLYVDPAEQRRGVGSVLLRDAQSKRPSGLDLWVFERNRAAIAFYEAHGFGIVDTTAGAGNEEREPDARMAWPSA